MAKMQLTNGGRNILVFSAGLGIAPAILLTWGHFDPRFPHGVAQGIFSAALMFISVFASFFLPGAVLGACWGRGKAIVDFIGKNALLFSAGAGAGIGGFMGYAALREDPEREFSGDPGWLAFLVFLWFVATFAVFIALPAVIALLLRLRRKRGG